MVCTCFPMGFDHLAHRDVQQRASPRCHPFIGRYPSGTRHCWRSTAGADEDPQYFGFRRDPQRAPILWRSEFRNILAGYVRRNDLSFEQAVSLQAEAESLLAGGEHEVESRAVLELVRDSDCSAYDCEFIALAMKLDTKLFTMDKKLLRAFPSRNRWLSKAIRRCTVCRPPPTR